MGIRGVACSSVALRRGGCAENSAKDVNFKFNCEYSTVPGYWWRGGAVAMWRCRLDTVKAEG